MTDSKIHIDIKVSAKGLTDETYDGYERLLQPFTRTPRKDMYMNLNKSTSVDGVKCEVHVYGRCVLDTNLRDAVFDLVNHLPEARVELSCGAQMARAATAVRRGAQIQASREALELHMQQDTFRVVLEGAGREISDNDNQQRMFG